MMMPKPAPKSRQDFTKTHERNKFSFKYVMEHVILEYHINATFVCFEFATLVSLKVPSELLRTFFTYYYIYSQRIFR